MLPVVTPEEMVAVDAAATEPTEVLIERAGMAVAMTAIRMLGGSYGRRVVALCGKGNNGNDGRVAARLLRARGVRCVEIDAASAPDRLPAADLVIDAAYGTGFRGTYRAPFVEPGTPILAVDIPSGVDGLTGQVSGEPDHVLTATCTVTFAAWKPGLILHPGAPYAGTVEVVDIGLDVSRASIHLVTADDVARDYPIRATDAHKWQSAVWVVGGSPGLEGAAVLTSSAALRAGAGYVRWSPIGQEPTASKPSELVTTALPAEGWAAAIETDAPRFAALTIGNGLGTQFDRGELLRVLRSVDKPMVIDGDALSVLGPDLIGLDRPKVVLTPHDGEFARIAGAPPGQDRISATRDLSARTGTVVLAKGPATVIAHPDGRVVLVNGGDARLATLGTGDVLSGVIAALIARGLERFRAAALGAFIHARAADLGWRDGLVAGDIVDLLPAAIDALVPRLDPAGLAN